MPALRSGAAGGGEGIASVLHPLSELQDEDWVRGQHGAAPLAQAQAARRFEAAKLVPGLVALFSAQHFAAPLQHQRDAGCNVPDPRNPEGCERQSAAGGQRQLQRDAAERAHVPAVPCLFPARYLLFKGGRQCSQAGGRDFGAGANMRRTAVHRGTVATARENNAGVPSGPTGE